MVDITILEVNLPDAAFNAPFAAGGDTGDGTADDGGETVEPGGGAAGSALAVLLVLAGLAALAWYLRRGRENDGG